MSGRLPLQDAKANKDAKDAKGNKALITCTLFKTKPSSKPHCYLSNKSNIISRLDKVLQTYDKEYKNDAGPKGIARRDRFAALITKLKSVEGDIFTPKELFDISDFYVTEAAQVKLWSHLVYELKNALITILQVPPYPFRPCTHNLGLTAGAHVNASNFLNEIAWIDKHLDERIALLKEAAGNSSLAIMPLVQADLTRHPTAVT